ncbi:MAG: ABC transporter substrate-binding protein [Methanomicrobiales archaeon]|nr:ABC transporter substrate-binding protein [Methanomicrobiales archaeon]
MQGFPSSRGLFIAGSLLLLLRVHPSAAGLFSPARTSPSVSLLYASSGSLPQLLNTGQIDAFLVWEPVVSQAELSGIGKRIAIPADLPPEGKWDDAAINVLVLRKDITQTYPDLSATLSALTTAAINRTNGDRVQAETITANWVFGTEPILTPQGTLDPLAVENHSFSNMVFIASAEPPDSDLVRYTIESTCGETCPYNPLDWVNTEVMERAERFLNGTAFPRIGTEIPTLDIGYIPSSDNYAPVYVMVKDSQYFCDRYGFCIVPDDPTLSRPVQCTLLVNGTPAAHVNLQMGQSGGGIMTTIGQYALDGAFVGSVPAELQIGLGNPAEIIQSVNTGGSGLVVKNGSLLRSWNDFVLWVKIRSATRRPVVIATVQSSIQEDMVREACAAENISVILYGTDFQIDA